MPTIQVVLDDKLLKEADKAAKRAKVNRSALFREALKDYIKRLRIRELEERDRKGYELLPDTGEDVLIWEEAAVWPKD